MNSCNEIEVLEVMCVDFWVVGAKDLGWKTCPNLLSFGCNANNNCVCSPHIFHFISIFWISLVQEHDHIYLSIPCRPLYLISMNVSPSRVWWTLFYFMSTKIYRIFSFTKLTFQQIKFWWFFILIFVKV